MSSVPFHKRYTFLVAIQPLMNVEVAAVQYNRKNVKSVTSISIFKQIPMLKPFRGADCVQRELVFDGLRICGVVAAYTFRSGLFIPLNSSATDYIGSGLKSTWN